MSFDTQVEERIKQGIHLARENKRGEAETAFAEVLDMQPNHETALIWKAAVTNDPAEAVQCLERALQVNPQSQRARAGLEWARRRLQAARVSQFPDSSEKDYEQPSISIGQPSHLTNRSNQPGAENNSTFLKEENPKVINFPLQNRPEKNIGEVTQNIAKGSDTSSGVEKISKVSNPSPQDVQKPVVQPNTSKISSSEVSSNYNETSEQTPPYKKSRFNTQQAKSSTLKASSKATKKEKGVLEPTNWLPKDSSRIFGGVIKGRKGQSGKQKKVNQSFTASSAPSVTLSDKVRQQGLEEDEFRHHTNATARGSFNLFLPLGLFVVAILLGFLTFLSAALSPVLGVVAVVIAVIGVILFNQSDF